MNQEQENKEKAQRAALEAQARAAISAEVACIITRANSHWLAKAAAHGALQACPLLTLSEGEVIVELEELDDDSKGSPLVFWLIDDQLPEPEQRAAMVDLANEFGVPPPDFENADDAMEAFDAWISGNAEAREKVRAALLAGDTCIDEDYLCEAVDELIEGSRLFDADAILEEVLREQLGCIANLDAQSLWRVVADGTIGVALHANRPDVFVSVRCTRGSSSQPDRSDNVTGYLMNSTGFGDEVREPVAGLAAEWGVELPKVLDEDGDEVTDESDWLAGIGDWFLKTPGAISGARKTLAARAAGEDDKQGREEIVRRWLEEQELA